MKRLVLLIAALLTCAQAGASGDYGPSYTRYKAFTAPDGDLKRFQEGQLGVLQPGMQRVYLYTAWRAITLGADIKSAAGIEGGLARADGSAFGNGWDGDGGLIKPEDWLRATRLADSLFGACPGAANDFAMITLKSLGPRKDATPARIKAWVDAQELVSANCKAAADARYSGADTLLKAVAPAPLSASEPAYWRQLRDYQRAAAHFHAERYGEATALFDQIGASADHPMRDLGAYLALRSEVRKTVKEGSGAMAPLEQRGQAILADASLKARHEAARATLRAARVHVAPYATFADLSKLLANAKADPFTDDRLGDWAAAKRVADELQAPRAVSLADIREKYEYMVWIDNLRACAYATGKDQSCKGQAQRALAQWQRSKSRPWLTAALMLSASLNPAMEKAAVAVKPADPEYLTIQYHLARLYRLAGRIDEARALSEAALKFDMADGSRNLFREERFALATSVTDAADYMLRVDVDMSRGEDKPVLSLNDDALHWLMHGLGSADMVVMARGSLIDPLIRARLASGAWMRADLLGKYDIALQALDVLDPLVPSMKADTAAYRQAKSPAERRHLMLLTALRFGLSPQMEERSRPIAAMGKDEVAASNWCSFKAERAPGESDFVWQLPPPPVVGDSAAATAEMEKLSKLKTATGFVGDHVMARVESNASDPDLPWLLHVVVASTRGGCLDPDAKQLSRAAHGVLHKRFPRHEWTRKTPYFY